jgi:hypothetical protein
MAVPLDVIRLPHSLASLTPHDNTASEHQGRERGQARCITYIVLDGMVADESSNTASHAGAVSAKQDEVRRAMDVPTHQWNEWQRVGNLQPTRRKPRVSTLMHE